MPLTVRTIQAAKPESRIRKLFDEKGLFLLVHPSGGKWWRFKYRFGPRADGKPGKAEKVLALGLYPEISLADARERRDDARRLLARGIDPMAQKKSLERQQRLAKLNSLELVARAWVAKQSAAWTTEYRDRVIKRFEQNVFPWVGSHPVGDVERADIRACLKRMTSRGAIETAHRVLQLCSAVFEYANHEELTDRNPCRGLSEVLPPVVVKHHASITDPKQIGALLRAIDGYTGTFVVQCALRLAPLLFVRPGELRKADWSELDLETKHWRIPAERMKMREQHIVPLSDQAIQILKDLQPLTGPNGLVFPGLRSSARPMSENTLNAALRRLGYPKDAMTAHGFRSMASTLLHEQGWPSDAIERQLAHGERDEIKAAYNYAEYLPKRREMMQAWADYLDGLRTGAKVVNINIAKSA